MVLFIKYFMHFLQSNGRSFHHHRLDLDLTRQPLFVKALLNKVVVLFTIYFSSSWYCLQSRSGFKVVRGTTSVDVQAAFVPEGGTISYGNTYDL